METPTSGRVTPTIIRTPATSSAESDSDQPTKMPAKTQETESEADQHTQMPAKAPETESEAGARLSVSSIPKSVIETSTPDSSSVQDKKSPAPSDGPTSCSTPVLSNASGDREDPSTPSRPVDLDFEGSIASQLTMGSTNTYHSAVTFAEPEISAPIVGYEIMEQRAKFTVSVITIADYF